MKIEITDVDGQELMKILSQFPVGKVLVEEDKAFWESTPQPAPTQPVYQPQPMAMQQMQPQQMPQ